MKKKSLIVILIIAVLLMIMTVVACTEYKPPSNEPDAAALTRTQLITNGTFYSASTTERGQYIKGNVPGWDVYSGSLRTNTDYVYYGVIDLANKDGYASRMAKDFSVGNELFTNPGVDPKTPKEKDEEKNETDELEDTNALIIASNRLQGSIYYKNSSSFTLEKDKYYLLTYSVCSKIDTTSNDITGGTAAADRKGAWLVVDGGFTYIDGAINTNGKWEQRSILIEANKFNSKTFDIYLWLGYGPEKINSNDNPTSTRGAVIFDNIICEEVTTFSDPMYDEGKIQQLSHDKFDLMMKNSDTERIVNKYVKYDKDGKPKQGANATVADETYKFSYLELFGQIGYESMYYLSDLKLEQGTEVTHTGTTAGNFFESFREGTYSSLNVKNYSMTKGKNDLSSSDMPTVTNAYSGIVDLSKLYTISDYEVDAKPARDKNNYSTIPSMTSYTFNAPTYDEWFNYILEKNSDAAVKRNISALDELKCLMIYNNDLTGVGYKNNADLKIEKDTFYVIKVWAYVWLPTKTTTVDGVTTTEVIYPTTNKPELPKTDNWNELLFYVSALSKSAFIGTPDDDDRNNTAYDDILNFFKTPASVTNPELDAEADLAKRGKITGGSIGGETVTFLDAVKAWLNTISYVDKEGNEKRGIPPYVPAETGKPATGLSTTEIETLVNIFAFEYAKLLFTEAVTDANVPADIAILPSDALALLTTGTDALDLTDDLENVRWFAYNYQDTFLEKNTDWITIRDYNKDYETKNAAIIEYMAKYKTWADANGGQESPVPYATVKLTGAGDDIKRTTDTTKLINGWQEIAFYIQGNQLSDRNLKLEFWFGEGSATDYANLMIGGVFFDNISITQYAKGTEPNPPAGFAWEQIAPITDGTELTFGGLASEGVIDDLSNLWQAKPAEGTAQGDNKLISIDVTKHSETETLSLGEGKPTFNLYELIYKHSSPTASVLSFIPVDEPTAEYQKQTLVQILPNKSYRLSMWVKTVGLKDNESITIELLGGKEDKLKELTGAVATESSFRSEKDEDGNELWKEVVFYIQGDLIETNYVTLRLKMGTGTRWEQNYIEGEVRIAVINCSTIKYSEFSSSTKSGDIIKSYTFSNTTSATDAVTNGNFSSIDRSGTDEEKVFDENGKIKEGQVAATQNWTKGTEKTNTFDVWSSTGKTFTSNGNKLMWEEIIGYDYNGTQITPAYYEIYAKFKDEKGKDKEVFLAIVDIKDAVKEDNKFVYTVANAGKVSASFRIRGVGYYKNPDFTGFLADAVSSYSSYIHIPGVTLPSKADFDKLDEASQKAFFYEDLPENIAQKAEIKVGTVTNENLFVGVKGSDGMYTVNHQHTEAKPFNPIETYVSPYKTALQISSNYLTAISMKTSSSDTLSANSYYVVSVWVLTMGDAFASVTLSNVSNTLIATNMTENYIGYSNIRTNEKWVEYRFYIKMGSTSGSLGLELALGNTYARKITPPNATLTGGATVVAYNPDDLSIGSVYFDGVRYTTISEAQYEEYIKNVGTLVSSDGTVIKIESEGDGAFVKDGQVVPAGTVGSTWEWNRHTFPYLYSNEYLFCNLSSTIDSFDAFTENTETGDSAALGNSPKSYNWSKETEATGTVGKDYLYGIYNYERDAFGDKAEGRLFRLNSTKDTEATSEKQFTYPFEGFGGGEDFDIKAFVGFANGGYNSLVLSNKKMFAQYYTYSDYPTLASESWYKITFQAKTLIAREEDNGTFTTDGVYAEFRFSWTGNTEKYTSIMLNSSKRNANQSAYDAVTYTMYIYNENTSSQSPKWSFHLGTYEGDAKGLIGLLAIDQVEFVKMDDSGKEYEEFAAKYEAMSAEEKIKATFATYRYEPSDESGLGNGSDDDTTPPGKRKNPLLEGGTGWLLISSIVIGSMIVIVLVVVTIRKIRSRIPKTVKGENVVQTVKEATIVTSNPLEKEEILESDEFTDTPDRPVFNQRVIGKKKKK